MDTQTGFPGVRQYQLDSAIAEGFPDDSYFIKDGHECVMMTVYIPYSRIELSNVTSFENAMKSGVINALDQAGLKK